MQTPKFQVYEETGRLRQAAVFGPPSIEAYLASHCYNPETSLFFKDFDIEQGRDEFERFVGILRSLDVEVVNLRKTYATTLEKPRMSGTQIIDALITKASLIDDSCKSEVYPSEEKIRSTLETLLHTDARLYGEEHALALTIALSLDLQVPMGNIYFNRDQANVVNDTCILGSMKYDVRKPEVRIIETALRALGYTKFLQVNANEVFEGGDAWPFNRDLYVGSGMRTTPKAIEQIANFYHTKSRGTTYMVTIPTGNGWRTDMQNMHIDCIAMPVRPQKLAGCSYLLDNCAVTNMRTGERCPSFLSHADTKGYEIVEVPLAEQERLACNMLTIKPGVVVAPNCGNTPQTKAALEKHGITVYSPGFKYLTDGAGATHCMVLQLYRERERLIW